MRRDQRRARRRESTGRSGRAPTGGPSSTAPGATERRIGLAMLPLRVFIGGTFVYAGLDKLLFDPTFLNPAAPTSLAAQLAGFAHSSPLAPLIVLIAEPLAVPLGFLIALAEVAIGLGALTGLLGKASAWAGFSMALLLWLTASWSVHPYYLGPDLPYAAGWLTLALVGDGGVLSMAGALHRWGASAGFLDDPDRPTLPPVWAAQAEAADLERRRFLEGLALAGLTLALGGVAAVLGWRGRAALADAAPVPTTGPIAATAAPAATVATGPSTAVGDLATLQRQGSEAFQDPANGDPSVLVRLSDGRVLAYDAVCTHAGCTVQFDPAQDALLCPCHGAAFDARNHGAVLGGPTNIPLTELPITVDTKTGVISLAS